MDWLKRYETEILPLKTLASRVKEFADMCCPDFIYQDASYMSFSEAKIEEDSDRTVISLLYQTPSDDKPFQHVFTKWSRAQVLSHVGVRDKWFEPVNTKDAVEELNKRLGPMRDHMVRSMRSFDHTDIRLVRGFVSKHYADIADTAIMDALLALEPDGKILSRYSGKTDRASYVYMVSGDMIRIKGTPWGGLPGVVVKNSEVGYTSLWVIPALFTAGINLTPLVMEKSAYLRRIHRGDVNDLADQFKEALEKAASVWGPMEKKVEVLHGIMYAGLNELIAVMNDLLLSVGAPKSFSRRCEQIYRANANSAPTLHTGASMLGAILEYVRETTNQDDAFTVAATAGAVLLKLLT